MQVEERRYFSAYHANAAVRQILCVESEEAVIKKWKSAG